MARPRDLTFDVVKGIGIVEVLFHHTLSFTARKFTNHHSLEWWIMTICNRILHFAIPTFLLISALLLVRSLAKQDRPDLKSYFSRRVMTTLIPYLCWTFIYLLFRFFVLKSGPDIYPSTYQVPGMGWVTGPTIFMSPDARASILLSGKGYFHLYFFCVLIQLTLLLPLVLAILKRFRPSFRTVFAIAVACQLTFSLLQSFYFKFSAPGSLIWSYIPSMLMGSWFGLNWSRWDELWPKIRTTVWVALAIGGAVYIGKSISLYSGGTTINVLINISFSIYATSAALVVLAWAKQAKRESFVTSALAYVGSISLPIFVIHPMALYYLSGPTIGKFFDFVPFTPFWIFFPILIASIVATKVISWLRLDTILFGRRLAFAPFPLRRPAAKPSESLDGAG